MVTTKHKILSIVLCIMLAVSAVCVGTMAVSAASGDTVYVRANNGWSNLHCYMWSSGSGENAAWPGASMTHVEGDVYSYTLTGDFNNIIFNNGNGGSGNQTNDLVYAGNGKIYDLSSGSWSDYEEASTSATTATTATSATTATTATTPSGSGMTMYCNNTAGWSTLYCYMWSDGTGNNAAWPGVAMTNLGNNVWTYVSDKAYDNVIFNANGGSQTADLVATGHDGYIFDNSTSTWSVYDTSPLQVTSFTADPSSKIYPGTNVTLSTDAQSKTGAAISYKISVTGNGVTTVVSDYSSSNTGIWTPSATGSYTVNFEYKDSEGNTNSRSLTLTVEDDSSLVKPVIKSVFPYNLNAIALNSPVTVSVTAGGGKTGTNLLFYKYVVTDPNGEQNIPYYTLNDTYTFTPKTAGTYTVQVFVEGSDNSKVNKTYTYTASSDVPTQPTTTQPITQFDTTAPITTQPGVLKGDTNKDGVIDVNDVTYLQMALAKYDGITVTLEVADLCEDGILDIVDATYLQYKIAGLM